MLMMLVVPVMVMMMMMMLVRTMKPPNSVLQPATLKKGYEGALMGRRL